MSNTVMGNKIKEAFNVLMAASEEEVNRVPEEVFKNVFLPLFLNKETDSKASIGDWAAIAGNPFKPVDIIDSTGQIIFRVPSIYDREVLDLKVSTERTTSTGHILVTYSQLMALSPARAEKYLSSQMGNKISLTNVTQRALDRIKAWNIIFERYGLETVKIENDNKENNSDKVDDVTMIYDDEIL